MARKKWWTSKTIWLAVLQGLVGVLVALHTELPDVGVLLTLKSIADIGLRLLTTEPVK